MKKYLFCALAAASSLAGYAQAHKAGASYLLHTAGAPAARTTAIGDTLALRNFPVADTLHVYTTDSVNGGYTTGTNLWNDQAFAERYTFNGSDSSMRVAGVMAQFGGKVSATSTHSANLRVWTGSQPQMITATLFYSDFPNVVINTKTVPFTQLGIGTVADTLKTYWFDTLSPAVAGSFFVGYDMSYSWAAMGGDTIALACTKNGTRTTAPYWLTYPTDAEGDTLAIDTIINVQNATLWADNNWHDNYTDNDSIANHLAIFPIVLIGGTTGVSVTHKDLTLYGAYPNPASSVANLRFALASASTVSIRLMDMQGRSVVSYSLPLPAGEHTVPVAAAALPTGNYLYLIRTATGSGMAGKLTIAK